jgi:chromosome partitioning protein
MSSDSLPPYFRISPDRALEELGPPRAAEDFAAIAEACGRGRRDLASRGLDEAGEKRLRLFSTWEITKYLIPWRPPISAACCARTPTCPGPVGNRGRGQVVHLDEVLRLRAHFGAEGSKAKEYLPYRPQGVDAKIVAVANFKGGVGKTSTAAHLAMSAALDGYRVLVIDLDSQGSMTSIFGGRIEDEWETVFPLLARHYAAALRRKTSAGSTGARRPSHSTTRWRSAVDEVRRRDPPHPLAQHRPDRRAAEPLLVGVPDPGLAHGRARLEALGRARRHPGRGRRPEGLRPRLRRYPPCPGLPDDQRLAAADILLVPLGASPSSNSTRPGASSTCCIRPSRRSRRPRTWPARALGREEMRFEWDAVRAVVTRYDAAQQAEIALIQAYIGRSCRPTGRISPR